MAALVDIRTESPMAYEESKKNPDIRTNMYANMPQKQQVDHVGQTFGHVQNPAMYDVESNMPFMESFFWDNSPETYRLSRAVRMGFIRKVYGLLATQLVVTLAVIAVVTTVPSAKQFVQESHGLNALVLFLSMINVLGLFALKNSHPHNLILFGTFTLLESYAVGVVCTQYSNDIVLEAVLLTATVVVSLTMYTFQSKRDFSLMGQSLFSALAILTMWGSLSLLYGAPGSVYALAASIVFSLFIVFDTWLVIHKFSPDEYIAATLNIYLDVINLFLRILHIIAKLQRDRK